MRKSVFIVLLMGVCVFGLSADWAGTWYRNSLQDSAEIIISVSKPGAFHFAITAYSGAHTGEIEGDALINDNSAQCVLHEDDEDREVSFLRTDAGITVLTANCEGYFGGVGVLFDGEYVSKAVPEEKLADEYIAKIISHTDLIKRMKALLGKSFVSVVYRLHLASPEDSLDDFQATVISGCVQGICPEMAAIVMFTPKNLFYIAWIEDGNIYYVSSDAKYKKKFPKTITEWTKRFEGVKVIFR